LTELYQKQTATFYDDMNRGIGEHTIRDERVCDSCCMIGKSSPTLERILLLQCPAKMWRAKSRHLSGTMSKWRMRL